jgi:hypothetical protein
MSLQELREKVIIIQPTFKKKPFEEKNNTTLYKAKA